MPITEVETHSAIRVAVGVIVDGSKVCISLRPDHLHKGGLWEFPGGKIEEGEPLTAALKRELQEELGISPFSTSEFVNIDWAYPDKAVRLEVLLVEGFEGDAEGREGQEVRWVEIGELSDYQFPEANEAIVKKLQSLNF